MIFRGVRRTIFLLPVLLLQMAFSAHAENVKPDKPPDPEADSEAAMKFTVHDPRIETSKTGDSAWGMWDIGRPHPMQGKGAFDDYDVIGVTAGKRIHTDCSVYWNDPDSHKILCFSTQASLVYFLQAPQRNAARAEKRWHEMNKKPAS
jgi:hypothetical protein